MRRSYISVDVDTSVDVDFDEIIEQLDADDVAEIVKRKLPQGIAVEVGLGDGDVAYTRSVIARAEAAARRLPDLPNELRDLFWHVHGVAIA